MKVIIKKFLPAFLLDDYHFLWALISAIVFGFPSKKIKVIGVTGTNGKTTTIELASAIFKEAGYKVGLFSSSKTEIDNKQEENKLRMTMPGRGAVQKFLSQAVRANCDYAMIEVTSEGISQFRHLFINFVAAVLTNLSPEHIEAHGSFENYREAKEKLFESVKEVHILNLDDANVNFFLKYEAKEKYGYRLFSDKNEKVDLNFIIEGEKVEILASGIKFSVKETEFFLPLLGKFNTYNALAAISIALSQGIELETCKRALEKIKSVPGRMELIAEKPFYVFIDYAFTPNALSQVYETIKKSWQPKKMICVLGSCGGGRDKWKRPVLGELAASYCDKVIVTNEDPYDEDPAEIINQVATGAEKIVLKQGKIIGAVVMKIFERREAIRRAFFEAEAGDAVVITGKGSEPSICLANGKQIPWDEKKVAKEELEKILRN